MIFDNKQPYTSSKDGEGASGSAYCSLDVGGLKVLSCDTAGNTEVASWSTSVSQQKESLTASRKAAPADLCWQTMDTGTSRRRPVKACTECKQVKLRCDANETFPQPCARCTKRSLVCVIDSTFKRTPTRMRLQSVTNELRQLKQAINAQANDAASKTTGTTPSVIETTLLVPTRDKTPAGQQHERPIANGPFHLREDEACLLRLREAQLENCNFDQNDIRNLFLFFHRVLHPHLPIIDTTMPVRHIQETSPFLFWTILFIASRYHADYVSRSNILITAYTNLMNQTILKTPHSLHTIQAILCLCTWPLPLMYQLEDPSLMHAGIAVHAAFNLSLPRSLTSTSHTLAAVSQEHRETMAKTWLACFSVHTALSMFTGLPPSLRGAHELSTVEAILERSFVPPRLAIEAEIQRCVAKYHDAMLGDMEGSVRETLVQMCDRELDNIPLRLSCSLDSYLTFSFVVAKLHVYTVALVKEGETSTNKRRFDPHSRGATFQTLGMAAAIRTIDIYCNSFDQLFEQSESALINRYLALPKVYFRGALFATFFLLKYFALNNSCPAEDKLNARNKVLMVHAKLRATSPHQFSEPGRAATVIEVLCRHADSGNTDFGIEFEDRASASVAWGALVLASKIRGKGRWRTAILDNINPTSPIPSAQEAQLSEVDFIPSSDLSTSVPSDDNMSLPEDLWDQSFLDLLDFKAYDFNDLEGIV